MGLRLAIVGDFQDLRSRSLRGLIHESDRTDRVVFVRSEAEIPQLWR